MSGVVCLWSGLVSAQMSVVIKCGWPGLMAPPGLLNLRQTTQPSR